MPPTLTDVEDYGIGLLVLVAVLGVAVGAASVGALLHSEREQRQAPLAVAPAPVPDDVAEVLGALSATSVLLGPGEEVLRVSPDAYGHGLVRNGRILPAQVTARVAEARRTGSAPQGTVRLPRSALSPAQRAVCDVPGAP